MRLAVFGVIKLKILVFSFQVRLFWEIFQYHRIFENESIAHKVGKDRGISNYQKVKLKYVSKSK